jgi:transposase
MREQPQENEEMYAEKYRRLPDGYQPEVLIGVDPRKQNVVTAVIVGRVRPRQRKQGKRQKRWKRQRKGRKQRYLRGERVVQISTREYRHMAMMNKARDWHENLKLYERDYAVVIHSLPSFRMAHVDIYLHRLGKLWEHLGFRLEFSAQHAFVRHRFLQDRMKMKALDALAKRIVPVPSSQVCIAYGDWSNQAGIKSHPSAPVKGFARALQKRATVVPMDEYKTSKLCSLCHDPLEKARLLATNDDGEFELRKNRNVLRCANSACRANFWNRDVNAVHNILELLATRLMGLGRIVVFLLEGETGLNAT